MGGKMERDIELNPETSRKREEKKKKEKRAAAK